MRGIANPLSLNKARTGSNPVPSASTFLSNPELAEGELRK